VPSRGVMLPQFESWSQGWDACQCRVPRRPPSSVTSKVTTVTADSWLRVRAGLEVGCNLPTAVNYVRAGEAVRRGVHSRLEPTCTAAPIGLRRSSRLGVASSVRRLETRSALGLQGRPRRPSARAHLYAVVAAALLLSSNPDLGRGWSRLSSLWDRRGHVPAGFGGASGRLGWRGADIP
jgi:hypothetical protein